VNWSSRKRLPYRFSDHGDAKMGQKNTLDTSFWVAPLNDALAKGFSRASRVFTARNSGHAFCAVNCRAMDGLTMGIGSIKPPPA
jgi:hypothetical protein